MHLLWYVALAGAGVVAGFVNTLAGGGSVISVPALLLFGLPADMANASSRVSVLIQSITSSAAFARKGRVDRSAALDVVPLTIVGALAGAYVATLVPNRVFEPLLIGTMILMALAMLLHPEALAPPPGTEPRTVGRRPLMWLALLAAGFYGGLLQAGAGLILLALFAGGLRYDLVRANILKAVVIAGYTLFAVVIFAIHGDISWAPALAFSAGSASGAWIGAHVAITRGQGTIRAIVIVMVLVTCVVVVVR
jgi:uncharacterized protein